MKLTNKDIVELLNRIVSSDIITDAVYMRPQEYCDFNILRQDIRLMISKLNELSFSIENI